MNEQERQSLIMHIKEQSIGEHEPLDDFEMALFENKLRQFLIGKEDKK